MSDREFYARIVYEFGRGLSSGLLSQSDARKEPQTALPAGGRRSRTRNAPAPSREAPGQLPFPFDSAPAGPLPTSLQVNADNLAEAIAPGAASSAYEPMAPPLSQHDIERIEAILAGRVAPDTYVPDDADMEKKVGA